MVYKTSPKSRMPASCHPYKRWTKALLTATLVTTSSCFANTPSLFARRRPSSPCMTGTVPSPPVSAASSTEQDPTLLLENLQSKDSIEKLNSDLTKVLKDLRKDPRDKDIPPPFRETEQLCFSRTWYVRCENEQRIVTSYFLQSA